MYCKKCNRLLKNSSEKCPYCNFDNTVDITKLTNELKENIEIKKKKNPQKQIILIIIIMFVISLFFMIIYSIKDAKKETPLETLNKSTTTTTTNTKIFKYNNFIMNYTDSFGISKNMIFYKDNSNINIEINTITEEEYNQFIEINECLDSKIGELSSITFAEDNSYSHLIKDENIFYIIKINYINDMTIYNENVQLDISNILNTLKKK